MVRVDTKRTYKFQNCHVSEVDTTSMESCFDLLVSEGLKVKVTRNKVLVRDSFLLTARKMALLNQASTKIQSLNTEI